MLIKCPKCQSVYDLSDKLIPDDGLKMRCAQCGEIWTAQPQDALKKNKPASPHDIQKMFARLSKETQDLFDERQIKTVEKIRVVNITRYKHTINIVLLFIAILSILSILYYMRFDIVRLLPETERLYTKLDIVSVPYGRNLEFKNIKTAEITENNISKIKISGAIVNTGKYVTDIPPVKVDIHDKNGKQLLQTTHYLPLPRLEAGYNLLFNITVTNPNPFAKSIYVTFADNL